MENIKITEFQSEYTSQVKELIQTVLGSLGITAQNTKPNKDSDLDKISEIYSLRSRFWLAILDNKLIGTVGIEEIDNDVAKLKRMFVLPEFQGSGVGQKLFDTALNFAIKNDYKKIKLNTDKVMKRAHNFYEKNGFSKSGENEEKLFYERNF
ncbi:MAG: GNAT family N-acetyltransferase [Minisyncoccia bacterium]